MVTADELRPLRTKARDYEATERLKGRFAELWRSRQPFYLTAGDLEDIFRWKLDGQYGRGAERREQNPPNIYEVVTRSCFEVRCADRAYETRVRLGLLQAIPGVGVPVASAVLALVDPTNYCVIDFRGWRAVFGEDRRQFSVGDYLRYVAEVRPLASELGWSVQETDLAIWVVDLLRNGRAS